MILPLALSVTFTVKLLVPAVPGVPEIVPPADRVNPEGSVPTDTVHEYGGTPPDSPERLRIRSAHRAGRQRDDVVIPSAALTVNDSALVVLPPPLSDNRTVKADVPAADGVPLIIPVEAARVKPAGKVPSDTVHVTGETAPDAARVAE